MTRNTVTKYHEGLERSKKKLMSSIAEQAQEAEDNLAALTHLFQLRADYDFLKSQVVAILPLGVGGRFIWVEEQLVHRLAQDLGLDHLADAVISELNGDPYGPTIIPSRASIIMRDDDVKAS